MVRSTTKLPHRGTSYSINLYCYRSSVTIAQCIESSLGSKIHGQLDRSSGGGMVYTDGYVARHRARIRGLFTAVTVPTPVAHLVAQGHYQESLFHCE